MWFLVCVVLSRVVRCCVLCCSCSLVGLCKVSEMVVLVMVINVMMISSLISVKLEG